MGLLRDAFMKWLLEDAPHGDLTSELLIPRDCKVKAAVIAKSSGVVACIEDLSEVLELLGIRVECRVRSGQDFKAGDVLMFLEGSARSILLVERTLLNLLSYIFGVATSTRTLLNKVRMVNGRVRLAATRKVPPGLRYLVKRAVAYGGGDTHRFSLSDAVLVKDNHIAILGGVANAVKTARERASFMHKVEVEVKSLEEAIEAVEAGADIIMLDNMSVEECSNVLNELKRRGLRDKVIIEVSGGIGFDNITDYAKLDVDVISTSRITMNPERVDISLEVLEVLGN